MRIEIICTGDEVLTGKIVNTNFSYMSQKLEDVGLSVHWGTTVGDDRESLLRAFVQASERADAVIVNGGLGPPIDDPVGTACGFAVDIGRARFFFTPGVPRELRRMLEEQVIPRLLARSGLQATIHLKRFHSYGIGESHADALLAGVEQLV